jgi:hypothetical protein
MRTSPDFAKNPMGAHIDPDKLVAARKAGVSPSDLHERAWTGRVSFSESWPRQDFAILGFAALSLRCSAKADAHAAFFAASAASVPRICRVPSNLAAVVSNARTNTIFMSGRTLACGPCSAI